MLNYSNANIITNLPVYRFSPAYSFRESICCDHCYFCKVHFHIYVDMLIICLKVTSNYFMAGWLVRFLFTSCGESQTHSLEDSLIRL